MLLVWLILSLRSASTLKSIKVNSIRKESLFDSNAYLLRAELFKSNMDAISDNVKGRNTASTTSYEADETIFLHILILSIQKNYIEK